MNAPGENASIVVFSVGERVLVHREDKRLVLGTTAEIDLEKCRAKISYEDGSSSWSELASLKRLGAPENRRSDGKADNRKASSVQGLLSRPLADVSREGREGHRPGTARFRFSYDSRTLHWDDEHKMNSERIYCYCGRPGKCVAAVPC